MDILLLIVGLGLILAGANFLTDGSAALAQRFRVPEFIIGLTVVAVGTSTPELVVSVLSAIGGQSDVAIGNVVGSNIANILLILGVSATINPLSMGGITVWDLLMVLLSSVVVFLAAFTFKRKAVDRWEGTLFVAIYIAYIWYLIR